jgi:hypothetical protein
VHGFDCHDFGRRFGRKSGRFRRGHDFGSRLITRGRGFESQDFGSGLSRRDHAVGRWRFRSKFDDRLTMGSSSIRLQRGFGGRGARFSHDFGRVRDIDLRNRRFFDDGGRNHLTSLPPPIRERVRGRPGKVRVRPRDWRLFIARRAFGGRRSINHRVLHGSLRSDFGIPRFRCRLFLNRIDYRLFRN